MKTETNNEKSEAKTNPNPFSNINTFYLSGFRAFKNEQTIPIRPITLVFGPNSSGKSSLIKGLVYALDGEGSKQFEFMKWDEINDEPKHYLDWDRLVNSSSSEIKCSFLYNEKISRLDEEYMTEESVYQALKKPENYILNQMYISESNTNVYRLSSTFVFKSKFKDSNYNFVIEYGENINLIESKHFEKLLDQVQKCYESAGVKNSNKFKEYLREEIYNLSISFSHKPKNNRFKFVSLGFWTRFAEIRSEFIFGPEQHREILTGKKVIDEMNEKYCGFLELWNKGDKNLINDIISHYDEGFNYFTNQACENIKKYVNNGRFNPEYICEATSQVALSILTDVLHDAQPKVTTVGLAKILYIDSTRSFMNTSKDNSDDNFKSWRNFLENPITLATVNDWLKNKLHTNFQIRKTIKLKDRSDLEKLVSGEIPIEDVALDGSAGLKIEDTRVKGRLLHIEDVGYGLQKLLPVLAAGSAVKFDKSNITQDIDIIAIEEPEMHLHPKLQSDLGDLFVDSVINNSEKTFILETHSENLLQRILRRVREGKISHEAISILYVQPSVGDEGAIVKPLEIDEVGEFKTVWPKGFFDSREDDILA